MVVRALTRELLALDTPHEWVVFVDAAAHEAFPYVRPGVRVVPVWTGNNLLSNVFVVPVAAARLGMDVTLYQNFAPPWGRGRTVALIYDVLFESHPEYYTRAERLYFAPLKLLAARADRLCTISASERTRMLGLGYGEASRIDVVHLGVDGIFQPVARQDPALVTEVRRSLKLPDRFLLFVGRLNARKNVAGLMRALALLRDRSVACVVVGAADWKADDAVQLARDVGLAERVHFVGSQGSAELAAIYSLATAFCFPSFEEGFGLPPLEAMASGVPVVVSDRSSLREVCGDAAVYVDPSDPRSIAEGLDRVLADAQLQDGLREQGLVRAAGFTWPRAAADVLACLERAVQQ